MSDFLNRTDLTVYVRSGNDPDYPDPPWMEVPPGSANATLIATVPGRYLKITGDVLSEMDAGEKATVDAAEAAAQAATAKTDALADPDLTLADVGFRLRSLIELFNKRDNYLANRILELQEDLQAIKASSGPADNIRAAIRPSYLATQTRARPAAVSEYKANITSGSVDT